MAEGEEEREFACASPSRTTGTLETPSKQFWRKSFMLCLYSGDGDAHHVKAGLSCSGFILGHCLESSRVAEKNFQV